MRLVILRYLLAGSILSCPLIAWAQERPLIVEAVANGDHARLRQLIADNANIDSPQGDGATALHWASYLNDTEAIQILLDAGASVNVANDLGATPLWLASTNGSAALIQRLLEHGANPNAALRMGETPLMAAARSGNLPAIRLLLEYGSNVNETENERDQTALMWAAAQRHADSVRLLVEEGANLHARSFVWNQLENTAGNTDGSGNINFSHGGSTPLLFVARNGDVETARVLIAAGASPNDTAASGNSALTIASHSGHTALAVYLLEKGADPNAAKGGYTALHAAVLRGKLNLVKALLEHGADVNARLERGTPVRRFSADYSLRHRLIGANAFWLAARYGEPEILAVLAEHGADPTMTPKSGVPALHAAIGTRKMGFYGNRRDRSGVSSLNQANEETLVLKLVRIAIDSGIDINAVDNRSNTALHDAVRGSYKSVVELLASKGAHLDAVNKDGHTALSLANLASKRTDNGEPTPDSSLLKLLEQLEESATQ